MAQDKHTGRKIALGTAIAGVTGYLAGILTAPKSGKETRQDIADKAEDIKDDTGEQLEQLDYELKELLNKTKVKTIALSSQARQEFDEAVIKAKDARNKSTTMLKALKAGSASDPDLNRAIKQGKQAKKNLGKYFKS